MHGFGLSVSERWLVVLALFGMAIVTPACERAEVREHVVPKGVESVPEQGQTRPAVDPPTTEATPDPWRAPAGWVHDPEPRPMRVATYIAPDEAGPVEVALTRFGGNVGGELANVNRWRAQMGLPAIEPADLESAIVRFEVPGFDGYAARIESEAGIMLAYGVYERAGDQTWFVRATVHDAAVADRIEPGVREMARSIAGLNEDRNGG